MELRPQGAGLRPIRGGTETSGGGGGGGGTETHTGWNLDLRVGGGTDRNMPS